MEISFRAAALSDFSEVVRMPVDDILGAEREEFAPF